MYQQTITKQILNCFKFINAKQHYSTQTTGKLLRAFFRPLKTSSKRFSKTMEGISFVGTSERGITKEIEIPVPWGKIAGKTYGDPTHFPVACMHGWLDNCNTFDELIPFLPKDKFYVMMDFPGHGASSPLHVGMPYDMPTYINMLQRVVKHYNWSVFSIIGHSLGGNVGALYSGTFPEKVDKLIIIDVTGMIPRQATLLPQQLRKSIESYLSFEDDPNKYFAGYDYEHAKQKLISANVSLTDKAADILLQRGTTQLKNGTYSFNRDPRHKMKHPMSMTPDIGLAFIGNIEAEVLHILGKQGMLRTTMSDTNLKVVQRILTAFTKSEYHETIDVEGKHHLHLCNPQNASGPIMDFLSRPLRSKLMDNQSNVSPNM